MGFLKNKRLWVVFSTVALGVSALLPLMLPVMAQVPRPAPDAEQQQCEPTRQAILQLNQKPRWQRVFYQPRIAQLKRQYSRCFQTIQSQEFDYLRQAEIPNHAGPKLPLNPSLSPTPTAKKHWWQR
jgi:hypothetical protein